MLKVKRVYGVLVPEKFRRSFRLWRHKLFVSLKAIPVRLNDKSIREMSSRMRLLKDTYKDNRCIIMGNGPSLNKMDLSLFTNDYIWASNRAYLLFDRVNWRPKFYVGVDTRVIPDNAKEINLLPNFMPELLFFFPAEFRYDQILNSGNNVYWYNEIPLNEKNLPFSMFSFDPSEFVYSVRSVTIAMLQLAVYLGFNPIYLIGCDTNYTIPNSVQFDNGNNEFLISSENDPNHFDPSYFGQGKKWNDPHVDRMIFHYEQAKKACDEKNIKIFNATVGGNLEVFPRIDYLDLFK